MQIASNDSPKRPSFAAAPHVEGRKREKAKGNSCRVRKKRETPVAQCKDIQGPPRASFWASKASYSKTIRAASSQTFHERASNQEGKVKPCFSQEARWIPPPIRWRILSPCLHGPQSPGTGTMFVWRSNSPVHSCSLQGTCDKAIFSA